MESYKAKAANLPADFTFLYETFYLLRFKPSAISLSLSQHENIGVYHYKPAIEGL